LLSFLYCICSVNLLERSISALSNHVGSKICKLKVYMVARYPRSRAWQPRNTARVPPVVRRRVSRISSGSGMLSPWKRYTAWRQVGPQVVSSGWNSMAKFLIGRVSMYFADAAAGARKKVSREPLWVEEGCRFSLQERGVFSFALFRMSGFRRPNVLR
jgi:hypothetical protein